MAMIPAPSRVLKQYSTWILIATGLFDLAHVLLAGMADIHVLTTQQLALANLVLAFLSGAAKLVQQQIAATAEQKVEIVERAASLPVKKGEIDPEITIEVAAPPTVTGDSK
jgi:predicted RNA methylase